MSTLLLIAACAIAEGMFAWAHMMLPYYTNLVLLYLFPIVIATWLIGRPAGFMVAFLSSAFWLLGQTLNRPEEVPLYIHAWNAFVRVIIFFGLVLLVEWMRRTISYNEGVTARLNARRSFLASVSHEMRDPLQRILTGLEILQGDHNRPVIDRVRDATMDLLELVDGILELARVEGANTLFRADFNPVQIMRELLEHLQPMATKRAQVFSIEIDPGTPTFVRADQTCLRYTVTRLLRDASQFSGTGAIVISVKFSPAESTLLISVQDFAPGAASSASGQRARDGLGLHVAREMAKLNGGRIWKGQSVGSESIHHFAMPVEVL